MSIPQPKSLPHSLWAKRGPDRSIGRLLPRCGTANLKCEGNGYTVCDIPANFKRKARQGFHQMLGIIPELNGYYLFRRIRNKLAKKMPTDASAG